MSSVRRATAIEHHIIVLLANAEYRLVEARVRIMEGK
jgi:hypothetical protein